MNVLLAGIVTIQIVAQAPAPVMAQDIEGTVGTNADGFSGSNEEVIEDTNLVVTRSTNTSSSTEPKTVANLQEISWEELADPSAQDFEDPFRDLDTKSLSLLRTVAVKRQQLANNAMPADREQNKMLLTEAEAALQAANLDADWLLSQRWVVVERRKLAASSGNPEFDGRIVTMKGFAIPAPESSDGIANGYLVQESGMCSHIPPPPPNRMVRLRFSDEAEAVQYNEPLRITGRLMINPSSTSILLVDGIRSMDATWTLEVIDVERVSMDNQPPKTSLWPLAIKPRKSANTTED